MTPKQQMMIDYLDGKITNVEIIEAWDRQREQNKRYRDFLNKLCDTDDIVEVYDIVDEYKALERAE
ncbi:hypothetical protein [Oceanobacillus indicireducens]|uniref:Uncharacterized protein n=1 Tax=Oceanobacillus indicireducens TaxID=1004261 RepID=A0A918D4D1_9BACI|nr:hypothetical protein [Oceanobacillus indicireducens]GGN64500.1 hypothetical protein GCM10007971_32430 [Oceanobacillus indicireducens]